MPRKDVNPWRCQNSQLIFLHDPLCFCSADMCCLCLAPSQLEYKNQFLQVSPLVPNVTWWRNLLNPLGLACSAPCSFPRLIRGLNPSTEVLTSADLQCVSQIFPQTALSLRGSETASATLLLSLGIHNGTGFLHSDGTTLIHVIYASIKYLVPSEYKGIWSGILFFQ